MRDGLITHPDKVLFAERGETKADLAAHYVRAAEPLLRTMGGRPVLLQRFPEGAGGPSFFQKRVPKNIPDWLQTTTVVSSHGGRSFGTRFWKNDGPPAPFGNRCMRTGRPPMARSSGSRTRT